MKFLDSKAIPTIVKAKNLLFYVILCTEEVSEQHISLERLLDASFNEIQQLSISVWSTSLILHVLSNSQYTNTSPL